MGKIGVVVPLHNSGANVSLSRMATITPTLAYEILESANKGNRKLNAAKVKKYTDDMAAGHWRGDNGESIKFDNTGRLVDGQHRLHAIIKAGVTIDLEIREGLDPDTIITIDTGKNRSTGDVLSINHGLATEDAGGISKALNLISQYEKEQSLQMSGRNTLTASHAQDKFLELGAELHAALSFVKDCLPGRGKRLLSHGDQIFLAYVLREAGGEQGEMFLMKVLKGDFIEPNTNESILREMLIQQMRAKGRHKHPQHVILHTVIRAWNYMLQGRVYSDAGNMRYVAGNKVPVAIVA